MTDQRTGLVWQQNEDGQKLNWEGAIAYCEGLSLATQSDWRLPNAKELEPITVDTRAIPAIDPIFPVTGDIGTYYFWSSTTDVTNSSRAWYGDFGGGIGNGLFKSSSNYARCVRGGQ